MKTQFWLIFVISITILWGCEQTSTTSPQVTPEVTIAEEPATKTAEEKVINLLRQEEEFVQLSADDFEVLGWNLPDGGQQVKQLAEAATGGAFNPSDLEDLPINDLGYQAKWHELRFNKYGLEWDITGLYLQPNDPVANLPTYVQIHGGSGNWYQFFLTPLNEPGFGQYLAQKIPVLLVTIPGNYQHDGWSEAAAERKPRYLLDRVLSDEEMQVRNAIYTFQLISEGVAQLVDSVTTGPIVMSGHSTGGEIQFLLKDRLRDRMQGLSFGWGTGGPARLRRAWADSASAEHNQTGEIHYRPITEVRGRGPEGWTHGYIGPFNPFLARQSTNIYDWYFRIISDPDLLLNTAKSYYENESIRRPFFKQHIQDIEHTGQIELRDQMVEEIKRVAAGSQLPVNVEDVMVDLFSTVRTDMTGYNKMVWTSSTLDEGHWDIDPSKARELFIANQYRKENPQAKIRMLLYDSLMTHIGYAEKPRQLAGGTFAAIQWLYSEDGD